LVDRLKHLRPVRDADDYTSGKPSVVDATQPDASDFPVGGEVAAEIFNRTTSEADAAPAEQPPAKAPSAFMQAAMANEKLLRGMLEAVLRPLDALRQEQDAFSHDLLLKVDQHVRAGFDLAERLEKMEENLPPMRIYIGKMRTHMGKALVPDPTTDDKAVF
jgi:hypothetical protein